MSATDIRVCFLGDSFVNGTGDPAYLGWVGRVCADARKNKYDVTAYNLGIRRDTSRDVLVRWRRECDARFRDDTDNRIVVSFGANDTTQEESRLRVPREETLRNLQALLSEILRDYRVLVIGPPPVTEETHNGRIASLCYAMQQVAREQGVAYLPVYERLAGSDVWGSEARQNDGAHPLSGGYDLLASIILRWDQWWFRQRE